MHSARVQFSLAAIMEGEFITPESLLEKFSEQHILVIGDVMLDWFIWGSVARISPEAPVPVVEVQRESRYPGGAANVARNITPFGTRIELAGLYGTDPNGALLAHTLGECGIGTGLCLQDEGMQTITKTRVVARQQQVVRIDREKRRSISADQVATLMENLQPVLSDLDGIIIEDYGKGLITPELVDALLKAAEPHGLVITVDPKPGNPIEWRGVTTVKPNRSEAFACAGVGDLNRDSGLDPLADEPLLSVGHALLEKWACHQVLLTLGEQGMLVFSGGEAPVLMPAKAREVFDVSGAGDTAIALFTLCLCAGLPASRAAAIANLASSIVVGKLGTSPIEKAELLESIQREYPNGIPLS